MGAELVAEVTLPAVSMAVDGSSTSVIMAHNKAYQVHMCDYYSSTPDVVPSGVSERKISPSHTCDMMTLDVITIKDSDAPVHRKKRDVDTYVLGTIHPFRKTHRSILGKFFQEISLVASNRRVVVEDSSLWCVESDVYGLSADVVQFYQQYG
ncbi:Zinc transporter 6 [Triplophysa tibetana]|uniref:Zinc transporter 6 n=1 Tax=Triplophysa tibetana TaxID=1572043 RepID=A0A5A9P6F3_9TELE|nr:Zinc transporter 6 [Triplophysa tibetana]